MSDNYEVSGVNGPFNQRRFSRKSSKSSRSGKNTTDALTYSDNEYGQEETVTESRGVHFVEEENEEDSFTEGGPEIADVESIQHKMEIHERIGIAYK